MLTKVWKEFGYVMDIYHTSGGRHIEHLTLQALYKKPYIHAF